MQRRGFFKTLCAAALALMTPVAAKPAGKVLIACGRPNLNNDIFNLPPFGTFAGNRYFSSCGVMLDNSNINDIGNVKYILTDYGKKRGKSEKYPDAFNASNVNESDVR